jgi:hypothetical protein
MLDTQYKNKENIFNDTLKKEEKCVKERKR